MAVGSTCSFEHWPHRLGASHVSDVYEVPSLTESASAVQENAPWAYTQAGFVGCQPVDCVHDGWFDCAWRANDFDYCWIPQGGDGSTLKYLEKFVKTLETYLQPANFGRWVLKLRDFIKRLISHFVSRIYRYLKSPWR